jgi:hypothetical protein
MTRRTSSFKDTCRALTQFGLSFIAVGALFGFLFGHGVLFGAIAGLLTCVLVLGVEWLYKSTR